VVGVNRFTNDEPPPAIASPDFSRLENEQAASLQSVRASRDSEAVDRSLIALAAAAKVLMGNESGVSAIMPSIVDAVRARASVGEISAVLIAEWGAYIPGA